MPALNRLLYIKQKVFPVTVAGTAQTREVGTGTGSNEPLVITVEPVTFGDSIVQILNGHFLQIGRKALPQYGITPIAVFPLSIAVGTIGILSQSRRHLF